MILSVLTPVDADEEGSEQGKWKDLRRMSDAAQAKTSFLNPEYVCLRLQHDAKEKPALLIYLHGSGGRGDEINKIQRQVAPLCRGVQRYVSSPCVVVAPQCLSKRVNGESSTWTPEDLNVFLADLKTSLSFDEKRVYLTGNSMGGYGCWVWAAHHPELFAAVAPVSGGIGRKGPKDVSPELDNWVVNLAKVPVFAFVGAQDRVVPAERSQRLIAAIQKAGGKQARLKVFPEEGHNARRLVYGKEELYRWMFSLSKPERDNDAKGK
ncbi:prolyl oligopeptidase family serine peptidase [Verrucomicrobiaceae bacterium N1E253]|uniref:Prolyl oligopeptidase family serine peptidase n=1 Tax=Oceaniferula marina TaxID=2748318 RepID=A0A851GE21_9BACT|nr:prolyl oligopeptidase family serine peptidase [Oceaniferula marina]NWK55793.1 prolyl oligopeptidase family serine peptidase [Oceaniferula marina]